MKKGFTMIELIFVIVILGILAAVAIPKLNATRDDAEVAKFATNISTILGDFQSYYTSKGELNTDLKVMTNVPLVGSGNAMQVKGKDCLNVAVDKTNSSVTFTKVTGSNYAGACKTVLEMSNIAAMLSASNSCGKTGETLTAEQKAAGCQTAGTAVTSNIKDNSRVTISYAASGVTW